MYYKQYKTMRLFTWKCVSQLDKKIYTTTARLTAIYSPKYSQNLI